MPEDRLDRIERILDRVAKEQELFALEMRQLQDAQDRLERAQAKTDEQLKETNGEIRQLRDAQAETDKYIKNLGKTVGELTGGWGKFIEGMMEPSVLRWVKEGLKLTLKEVARNKELYQNGKSVGEIDLFMEGVREDGSSLLVIVEAKSSFESSDMRTFKELIAHLYEYLPPRYKDTPAIVAIAATRFGDGVKRDALRSGLYVFESEDSVMKVTVPTKPKILKYKGNARR
jgi:hypothetical protein